MLWLFFIYIELRRKKIFAYIANPSENFPFMCSRELTVYFIRASSKQIMEQGFICNQYSCSQTLRLHGTKLKELLRKVTEQELIPDSFLSLNLRQKLQSYWLSSSSRSQVLPLHYKVVYVNYSLSNRSTKLASMKIININQAKDYFKYTKISKILF